MRVMTREVNQGVIIDQSVHVTVLEIREDSVRVGISFPRPDAPNIYDYREETIQADLSETITPEPLEPVR